MTSLDDRLAAVTADASGQERSSATGWSVAEYVCHVGDNLRQWAERVQAARFDNGIDVASYDQDRLAQVRGYGSIPLKVALWSASLAADSWCAVLRPALAERVACNHQAWGRMRAEDVARNNCHDAFHHLWDISSIRATGCRGVDDQADVSTNDGSSIAVPAEQSAVHEHVVIEPHILYVGTPVALLSTENPDGTANLAPMSSAWALGETVVLGLGVAGRTALNLLDRPDLVINFPEPGQWSAVELLAPLTGRNPVPEFKRSQYRFEPDKFGAAALTPVSSDLVRPPRVRECPLQFEARVQHIQTGHDDSFLVIEARVLRVHARADLVVKGTQHIDPTRWSPLIYNFRHYFGLGAQLGHTFRSETPDAVPNRSTNDPLPVSGPT